MSNYSNDNDYIDDLENDQYKVIKDINQYGNSLLKREGFLQKIFPEES